MVRPARFVALFLALALLAGCAGRQASPPPPSAIPKDPQAARAQGLKAMAAGSYMEALALLEHAAEARGTADDWNDYCFVLGKLDRWPDSLAACQKAVAADKEHPYALYNLGWAEYKLGQHLQARTHIGASEAIQEGKRWETRYALGLVAEALGEKSRAAVDFEAAAARSAGESGEPARALERVRDYLPLPLPAPQGWKVYTNGRFGFRIFYPEGWTPGPEPANGDGRFFVSPDGKAEIRAWGSLYSEPQEPGPAPDERPFLYGFRRAETAKDGTRLVWYRSFRLDEKLRIEYGVTVKAPLDQWQELQPVIDTVMRSFRITFGNAYARF